jgi:cytidylate kinase
LTIPTIIAIDGPAGSGKSTLAFFLAQDLGYLFFDTGVMYRAVTWAALDRKIPTKNEDEITCLAENIQIDVRTPTQQDGRQYDVLVDGQDVTWDIRSPNVEANVSPVSAYRGVRSAMSQQQRRIGLQGRVVMVGRDIGTVVLPEAGLKVYLDASMEERARRRYAEIIARGEDVTFEDILASICQRDKIDSTRVVSPLRPANDAVIINSDGKSIDQIIQIVRDLVYDIGM